MSKKISKEDFIARAKLIHGNKYDYSEINYNHSHYNLTIICPIHGKFYQSPANHLSGRNCFICAHQQRIKTKTFTKEDFINKAIEVHGDKYDYSKIDYTDSQSKVTITCIKHGDFEQRANAHLQGQGCTLCGDERTFTKLSSTTEQFVEKAKEIHGSKYNYSKVLYINTNTKIIIICPEHGEFQQRPSDHLKRQGCPGCNSSKGELAIKAILDKHNIYSIREYKIPEVVDNFEYDFYLPDYNILIEFQGIQHYKSIPFFGGEGNLEYVQRNDKFKKHNAYIWKYNLIEFNYLQLKYMSTEQFEQLIINSIIS